MQPQELHSVFEAVASHGPGFQYFLQYKQRTAARRIFVISTRRMTLVVFNSKHNLSGCHIKGCTINLTFQAQPKRQAFSKNLSSNTKVVSKLTVTFKLKSLIWIKAKVTGSLLDKHKTDAKNQKSKRQHLNKADSKQYISPPQY